MVLVYWRTGKHLQHGRKIWLILKSGRNNNKMFSNSYMLPLYTCGSSIYFIVKQLYTINMWYKSIGFHFFCKILLVLHTDHWYLYILVFHLSSFLNMDLLFKIIVGTLLFGIWTLYFIIVSTWAPEYNFSIVSDSQDSILASSCKTTRFVGTLWNGNWQCLSMRWISPFVSKAQHTKLKKVVL
jgi:hypothetical protein